MRIAIIAYDFPPLNSGGSQRPYFLAKFLKDQHVDVTIFTLNETNYPSGALNYEMDKDFRERNTIIRTNLSKQLTQGIFQSYYFNLVDTIGARWRKELVRLFEIEHTKNPFNYIISTCPPFSLGPLGVFISKKIKVPLILDMRDAWSLWVITPYASYFHYLATLWLERKTFKHANFITYTSEQQKRDWLLLHPELNEKKFIYIPNGFDSYENSNLKKDELITIFYSGSFYYNPKSERLVKAPWYKKKPYQYFQYVPRVEEWKYRSPFYFFRILRQLIIQSPQIASRIQVRFAGNKPEWFERMISDFGLQDYVIHLGFLNKPDVKKEMHQASYFLITSAKVTGSRDYSVAGKTYEYFSYRKPIIGVVNEGEQYDVLFKSGISCVLDPDDVEKSTNKLIEFLTVPMIRPDWDYINQFKIPNNYSNLARIFNQ